MTNRPQTFVSKRFEVSSSPDDKDDKMPLTVDISTVAADDNSDDNFLVNGSQSENLSSAGNDSEKLSSKSDDSENVDMPSSYEHLSSLSSERDDTSNLVPETVATPIVILSSEIGKNNGQKTVIDEMKIGNRFRFGDDIYTIYLTEQGRVYGKTDDGDCIGAPIDKVELLPDDTQPSASKFVFENDVLVEF